jgi:hypothetical protein
MVVTQVDEKMSENPYSIPNPDQPMHTKWGGTTLFSPLGWVGVWRGEIFDNVQRPEKSIGATFTVQTHRYQELLSKTRLLQKYSFTKSHEHVSSLRVARCSV